MLTLLASRLSGSARMISNGVPASRYTLCPRWLAEIAAKVMIAAVLATPTAMIALRGPFPIEGKGGSVGVVPAADIAGDGRLLLPADLSDAVVCPESGDEKRADLCSMWTAPDSGTV